MTTRIKFQPSPVAKAAAIFSLLLAGSTAVQAGPGFGESKDTIGTPILAPAYYANSPAGARQWANGAPSSFADPAAQSLYKTAVDAIYGAGNYPGTGTALRKFVDPLPLPAGHALAATNLPKLSDGVTDKYIPVAQTSKWVNPQGVTTTDDYLEIAAVEYTEKLHSDLKKPTTLRGYVQIDHVASNSEGAASLPGSKKVALTYPDGSTIYISKTDANGKLVVPAAKVPAIAYDAPHYLGPLVKATKDTPTRVKFHNLLPIGHAVVTGTTVSLDANGKPLRNGDLFLPVDPTIAGAGVGPDGMHRYTENRVNLHLQGGQNPWISAGGPHGWITPAGESDPAVAGSLASDATLDPTMLPSFARGVGAINVPDMNDPGAGAMTYYYPNAQSARIEWVRDQSIGIDRLNTYAGLVSPYLLTDPTEQSLISSGAIPGEADTIPLIIQDKTFVPDDIKLQDAKWDINAWGTGGDLWYPHVYEKLQDSSQQSGWNAVGRWHWGPSFWPSSPSVFDAPSGDYLGPSQVDPSVLESQATVVPEAFMDTPLVNGVAYPTLKVQAKPYRLRILNASNDRFITANLFVATNTVNVNGNVLTSPQGLTEVPIVPITSWSNVCAPGLTRSVKTTTTDPVTGAVTTSWCTPETWTTDIYGHPGGVPDWAAQGPALHQIASDGGLLPGVASKDATPLSYILDKGRTVVLNVDFANSGLMLTPSERADVVVDFSAYAGKTLILYNDSTSPVPGTDPRNDYFTGYGDMSAAGGAEDTRPGFGPNSRTIMQIVVAPAAAGTPAVDAATVDAALSGNLDAALKASYALAQERPLVAQSAYNGAFPGNNWNDTKAFASIFTGSVKQPAFEFVPGSPDTAFNSVLLQKPGAGYTRIPTVTLSGGGGTGATAETSLKIDKINIINAGKGYKIAPTVTIISNGKGNAATATTTLGVESVTVNSGGVGYTSAPTVTFAPSPLAKSDATATATGTATIAGGKLTAITVTNAGRGYAAVPVITLTGGGPVGVNAAKAVANGKLAEVLIDIPDPTHPETAGGGGYDDLSTAASEPGNPAPGLTLTFSAPPAGGTAATAGATGRLYHISLANHGKGYTSAPTVTITPSAAEPAPATITAATALADTAVPGGTPTGSLLVKTKTIQELWEPTYGRYNTTFGSELPFTSANTQTTIPMNYVDTPTEEISDGEIQIWKVTHNGLQSQAVHFTAADVQLVNRVGWDNYSTPPELNELGWKDTVMLSPLEDAIFAIRGRRNKTGGFGLPNSVRMLDPSQPPGAMSGFTQIDPFTGVPAVVANQEVDFGWEYLWQGTVLGRNPVDFHRAVIFHANEEVPATPTGLTGMTNGTQTDLTWADNSVTEFSYRIERSPLGANAWSVIDTALANATAYVDTTGGGGDYDYRVVAVGQNGEAVSNVVSVANPVIAPSNLAITAWTESTMSLSWLDNSTNEASFVLTWTSPTDARLGNLVLPSATGPATGATTAGTAAGLLPNTVYTFTVAARSATSTIADAQSVTGTTMPTAPTAVLGLLGVSAPGIGGATVNLTWNNPNPNLNTLYNVVISGTVGGVAITPVTLTGAQISTPGLATLTGLATNAAYSLTVTVTGAGGKASASTSGTTAGGVIAPGTPTATSSFNPNRITVSWADLSNNETRFVVLRSTNGSAFAQVGTVARTGAATTGIGGAAVTFNDGTVVVGNTYAYEIVAQVTTGGGANPTVTQTSTPSAASTPLFYGFAAPTGLTATLVNATRVTLSFVDQSVGESAFQIWRSDNGAAAVQIGTVNSAAAQRNLTGAVLSFNNNNNAAAPLVLGHTYTYTVVPVGGNNNTVIGATSAPVSVVFAAPAAPAALNAVVTSKTGGLGTPRAPFTDSVALSWAAVPGATSYTVQRQRVAGVGPFVAIINATNITTLSVIETGVPMSATPYVYQIRANGVVGNSAWTQQTVTAN